MVIDESSLDLLTDGEVVVAADKAHCVDQNG